MMSRADLSEGEMIHERIAPASSTKQIPGRWSNLPVHLALTSYKPQKHPGMNRNDPKYFHVEEHITHEGVSPHFQYNK